ncbi:MAG: phosphomannomutase/phosphoglucomutase [Patescibacteria group bacterium]|nr:phosphomannomutase/phosphoglucomutase [Patescibacteria group bacterium]
MPKLEKTMFREYDIRGRVSDKELNEESCKLIGKGFGSLLIMDYNVKEVVAAFDAREYSERLKNALIEGIISTGVNVIEIGQALVPIAYFAQRHLKIKGLAMLTASHNPNGWSGIKLGQDFETTLLPDEIKKLYQIILEEDFIEGKGEVSQKAGIIEVYGDYLTKKVKFKKPFKVVVDAGNGTAGPIIPPILRKAGVDVIEQHCDIDFSFPHHEPNPATLEALEDLSSKVKEVKADIGFGFDGDGDRLGVVDEKGNIIWPDRFLILLARQVLKEKPGSPIVFDVKSSQALIEEIEKYGGKPVMWKTGHSYIKQKAKELDAPLAGEKSGHIFYRHNYYGYDDPTFAALKILEYLSYQNRSLSEIMLDTPQYFSSPSWYADCADEVKYEVASKLTEEFKKEYGEDKVIDISGARVTFEDGWGLVRASSNLPVINMVFESKTKEGLERIKDIFRKKLAKYPEVGDEWTTG